MTPFTAFVGLGANLGDAAGTLKDAVATLAALPDSHLAGLSSLYRSAPVGPPGQPDYLNAVARLETRLTPHALLAALQAIEDVHGRVRRERWGPRTLDLDLLLYGNDTIATIDLVVPHAEMRHRNFVLVPMRELAPGLQLPGGEALAALPAASDLTGLSVAAPGPGWGH